MDLFNNRYFKLRRNLMMWIGQWPYDVSTTKSFQRAIISILSVSCTEVQIAKLLTAEYDLDLYVNIFTAILICMTCFVKYIVCWVNNEMLKELLEWVKYDWSMIKAVDELKIMQKYAEYGRVFVVVYVSLLLSGIGFLVLMTFTPMVLNVVLSMNISQLIPNHFEGEYFVDAQKYWYPIMIHTMISIVLVHTLAVASDSVFIVFMLHSCAIFKILGHRLAKLFDDTLSSIESEDAIAMWNYRFRERLQQCIEYYLRAIGFMKAVTNCYFIAYLVQLALVVLVLVVLLYRLFDTLTSLKSMEEVLLAAMHTMGFLLIMFLNIYPAQMVIDSSAESFYQAYYGRWYMAPARAQKLLIIVLQKCMEPCSFSFGNIITASLQIFAAIIQTSISYFTVLYALKQ